MLRLQVDASGEAKALRDKAAGAPLLHPRYLLYWYKSTKTDTNTKALRDKAAGAPLLHSLYSLYWHNSTCLTGTKAQKLTQILILALLVQKHKN
jgi:hypothetical protein